MLVSCKSSEYWNFGNIVCRLGFNKLICGKLFLNDKQIRKNENAISKFGTNCCPEWRTKNCGTKPVLLEQMVTLIMVATWFTSMNTLSKNKYYTFKTRVAFFQMAGGTKLMLYFHCGVSLVLCLSAHMSLHGKLRILYLHKNTLLQL